MKNFERNSELRSFEIDVLTGEACRAGARILCDVTDRGRKILCDLLGLPADTRFVENWNSGAIGSEMIPAKWFPMVHVWALLCDGALHVIRTHREGCIGFYSTDPADKLEELLEVHRHFQNLDRTFRIIGGLPGQGTRCLHHMSGRTE